MRGSTDKTPREASRSRATVLALAIALAALALPASASASGDPLAIGISGPGEVLCKVGAGAEGPCAAEYAPGTALTLIAHPSPHASGFAGWSAASGSAHCTGTANCTFTLTEASSVTATFTPIERTLTVSHSGSGEVLCEANGGAEGPCASAYPLHTEITLTPHAAAGFGFTGWSAGTASAFLCTDTAPCTIVLEKNSSVTAGFAAVYAVTLGKTGTGTGTVTATGELAPNGTLGTIECGAECTAQFLTHTNLTLTAIPDPGSTMANWGRTPCPGAGPCEKTIRIAGSRTIKAHFTALGTATLTVKLAGTGLGSVSSASESGIECGTICSFSPPTGTKVSLSADANSGSSFTGWKGCDSLNGLDQCVVTMAKARTVTATFSGGSSPAPSPSLSALSLAPTGRLEGKAALLKATCKGSAACKGTLKLSAKLGAKAKPIGSSSFDLSAGASSTLKVKLSARARRALRAKGTLKARAGGTGVDSRSLTLKRAGGL